MTTTPDTEAGDQGSGNLRRWIIIGMVIAVGVIILVAVGTWFYLFAGDAPPAPTIDDALRLLQTTAPTE